MTQKDFDETMKWVETVNIANSYTKEEWEIMCNSLSPEQIDMGLDVINETGLKKIGIDEEGKEIWGK